MKTTIMALIVFMTLLGLLSAQHPPGNKSEEAAIKPILSKEPPERQSAILVSIPPEEKRMGSLYKSASEVIHADSASASQGDTAEETDSSVPTGLELGQNYPNPFNSDTEIKYGLPVRASVYISVYNIFGQKVRTIKDDVEDSGYYSVNWDGRDDNGDLLASGMYFYVFASDDNYLTRKMMFLK